MLPLDPRSSLYRLDKLSRGRLLVPRILTLAAFGAIPSINQPAYNFSRFLGQHQIYVCESTSMN
jgi:hypothetical protein